MPRPTTELDAIADAIRTNWQAKHRARERALPLCRETIRHSANAIRAVHRGEFDDATRLIADARANLAEVEDGLREHQDIHHAGFVHDAQKEFAEASTTLALVRSAPLPTPVDLNVGDAAYLNGLSEAVGELRRHLLDRVRDGNLDACEDILAAMDDIYAILVTMDFPDALTGGLRRSTDVCRSILEKTRGDFTMLARQRELERAVAALQRDMTAPSGPRAPV